MGVALVTKHVLVIVEEEQGNAVFAVRLPFAVKAFNQLYITNNTAHNTEHSILKVGVPCALQSLQRHTGL